MSFPSSSSSPSPPWDVFLSFYDKDTSDITAHLYSALDQVAIRTYRDDPQLEESEDISSGLLKTIQNSKTCIVVLSKNYAFSPWCLYELVEILSCRRRKGLVVLPIFYHVNPSEVRHQKMSFGEALEIHEKCYSVDMVEKWRAALTEIADLSGYHLGKDANLMSFPSSSSSPPWDVFLSFYGKDTRNNFTARLYSALQQAAIRTYRDDPELEKGEDISSGLHKAIQDSKICIVVLSQNYAFSSWCLHELVQMLACRITNDLIVVPVFYHVDPSDVRHQKESFGEALEIQKTRYSVDKIEKWRAALTEIADLSGYHIGKDVNVTEADQVQQILKDVAPQVSTKALHLEEHLAGIDFVLEFCDKLSMQPNDINAIGMRGRGGIGETANAKPFYNKYFDKFHTICFAENVKETI